MNDPILTATGITKQFPGVKALDNIDFDLQAGEVHILVGENGAGKSTLAKVILGAYKQDEGTISFQGEKMNFNSTKDALAKGIVAVYQEFTLIPWLNVAQNIFINREYRTKFGLIDRKRMEQEAADLLKTLNCEYINVKSPVKMLSVAEQQMVEIAKALSFHPKIIVFDEPTATLSQREVDSLFVQIHKLKAAGIGIIYVSHRMQEFPLIGDRITVMRDGKKIATVGINDHSNEELVNMMVGRDISQVYKRTPNSHTGVALETKDLCDKAGKVKNASIVVNKGEIVGLAGLVGAGRTELINLIFGIDPIKSGTVLVNGKEVSPKSPVQMVKKGVGLVPEDRKRQGLALKDSIAWNIMAVSLKKYFPGFFVNKSRMYSISEGFKNDLRIVAPNVLKACKQLSGGNQQKVVLAKWLSAETDILIFDEPTRGIDVGAKMEIYTLMDKLASEGKAILMISSELPEVIGMSDRIYIMHEGVIGCESKRGESSADKIGSWMLGVGGGKNEE